MTGSRLLGAALCVPLLCACGGERAVDPRPAGNPGGTVSQEGRGTRLKFPDGESIIVEVASTPAQRQQGLMYRTSLAPDYGMLFVFPAEQVLPFWMRNTYVDLDMVFLDSGKRITVVHHDVPRSREDAADSEVARRTGHGRYVLELPAGQAKRRGLKRGQSLEFELGR